MDTWICTDLHGQYKLWNKIKKFVPENDKIIFLGDAVDRGEHGLKIMLELLADPRVTYLKGNHEEMMTDAYKYDDIDDFYLWCACNGGESTRTAIEKKFSTEEIKSFMNKINNLKEEEVIFVNDKMFICNHSGYYPFSNENSMDPYYLMKAEGAILWDRGQLESILRNNENNRYAEEFLLDQWKNKYVIHGHTPVQAIDEDKETVLQYAHGHKIDLDLASFEFNKIALFNTSDFMVYYFDNSDDYNYFKSEKLELSD